VQVRIGVQQTPREIEVEIDVDDDGDALVAQISKALGGDEPVLWLVDRRGRRVGVATDKLSYVEIGSDVGDRRVGFSAL
jgi:hypothetical protein